MGRRRGGEGVGVGFDPFLFFVGVAQPTSDVTLKGKKENSTDASFSFSIFNNGLHGSYEEEVFLSWGITLKLLWTLSSITSHSPFFLLFPLSVQRADCNAAGVSEQLPVELQL